MPEMSLVLAVTYHHKNNIDNAFISLRAAV